MTAGKRLVSVIVPVYKTAQYLSRCLDSILNNTYKELEVICVNDGSPDNSLEILRSYEAKDQRIVVIDQQNQGVSAARNAALDIATGEFIAFVDSDDWIHPKYFEALLTAQEKSKARCVACRYIKTEGEIPEGILQYPEGRMFDLKDIIEDNNAKLFVWGRIYEKTLISDICFSNKLRIGEDTLFNLTVLTRNDEVSFYMLSDALYYYYARRDSASHVIPHKETIEMCNGFYDLYKITKNINHKAALLLEILKKAMLCRYLTMFDANKKQIEKEYQYWIDKSLQEMKKIPGLSMQKKIQYLLLARIPILYRLMRIITDPTMLQWERNQRRKANEKK